MSVDAARDAAVAAVSRLGRRLPVGDLDLLSAAASQGPSGLATARAGSPSAVLRHACDELLAVAAGVTPDFLAGALAAVAFDARGRRRTRTEVVWTGPDGHGPVARLTAGVLVELLDDARREILLTSYAAHDEPTLSAALSRAVARGVEVTLLLERAVDNERYGHAGTPFAGLPARRLVWPKARRPAGGAALHAKVLVVDAEVALVGSANLTAFALQRNIECGVVLREPSQARAVRDHVLGLLAAGVLVQVA